jgi:VanZ family protein
MTFTFDDILLHNLLRKDITCIQCILPIQCHMLRPSHPPWIFREIKITNLFTTHISLAFIFTPYVPHAPPISFSSSVYHSDTRWRLQVTNLLIMQFSPASCFFLLLESSNCHTPLSKHHLPLFGGRLSELRHVWGYCHFGDICCRHLQERNSGNYRN